MHLSRLTPSLLVADALRLYDDDVRQCFTECTSVDTPDNAWQQAQLSLSRGGLVLRCLSHHTLEADKGTCTSEAPEEPAKRKRRTPLCLQVCQAKLAAIHLLNACMLSIE